MTTNPPTTSALSRVAGAARARIQHLQTEPDRGSHSVEYAIGIGASAAVILAIYAAFRAGLADVVAGWVFT